MQGSDDDFVMFPIPRRKYAEAVRALASVLGDPAAVPLAAVAVTDGGAPWTKEQLVVVARHGNTMTLSVLDLCAARPEEFIPMQEAADAAGLTHGQAKGQMAGLSQFCRRRLGREDWPFMAKWRAGGENKVYYKVDEEVARLWKEVRKAVRR